MLEMLERRLRTTQRECKYTHFLTGSQDLAPGSSNYKHVMIAGTKASALRTERARTEELTVLTSSTATPGRHRKRPGSLDPAKGKKRNKKGEENFELI